jgi:hypothetical protein
MKKWRTSILQRFNSKHCCMIVLSSLTVICVAEVATAQRRVTSAPSPSIRDRNRATDEYDRTLNRMRNDAKARALNARRRSLFPQIDEDFQRIQIIHNEIVRMYQPEKTLDYGRLAELTDDLRKRTSRLRENLSLPGPDKIEAKQTHAEAIDETHMRKDIVALHDLVVSFVANPIFKNLGVVDATEIDAASENLNNLIDISDEIKREAKLLGKTARK